MTTLHLMQKVYRSNIMSKRSPLLSISKRCYHQIESHRTVVKKTTSPVVKLPLEQLQFGKSFTDHMLEIDWTKSNGWETPIISPLHNLQLDPAASCLHYSFECFEGMKAYKDEQGKTRLFRPDMNAARLQRSMARVHLPEFNQKEFIECLKVCMCSSLICIYHVSLVHSGCCD